MADQNIPYGLRKTLLTPYTNAAATTLAEEGVDYPIARTFSFSEAEEFEELRGDDRVWTVRGKGASVEWEMEHGGITLGAYRTIAGGTLTTEGVSPNTRTVYRKKVTDSRPFFMAEGQAINDNGGDFHVLLYRCRSTGNLEGELADGAFWLTGASGSALPNLMAGDAIDALYDFISNEQITPLAPGGTPTPAPLWAATTAYALGAQVALSTGQILEANNAGTSAATEPVAPGAVNGTVVDGGVTWKRLS